jgi:plastocyanin
MAMRALVSRLALGLCLLSALPAAADLLAGRVQLVDKKGEPEAGADPEQAVVYFAPRTPPPLPAAGTTHEMVTRGKEFVPEVLAITRGSSVRFPNRDPILHNVFSVSGANRFDLGLYSRGAGKTWTFDSPGVVRVFCNVHHSMVAYIVVLDTPYFTSPDPQGAFTLSGVPAEAGTLTVWHPRTDSWSRPASPGGGVPVAARLTVTRARVPLHLNKFGRSYTRGRRDSYE